MYQLLAITNEIHEAFDKNLSLEVLSIFLDLFKHLIELWNWKSTFYVWD